MPSAKQSAAGVSSRPASKFSKLTLTPTSRIFFLRVLVASSLLITAAIVGTLNYLNISGNERNFAVSQYNAISVQALNVMVGSFNRMNKGALVLAKTYRHVFRNVTTWPNVALPGFYDFGVDLAEMSSLDNLIFNPVFMPDKVDEFAPFLIDYWKNEPGIEGGPIFPGAVHGVWATNHSFSPAKDPLKYFYKDTTGYIPPSKYETRYQNVMQGVTQLTFSTDATKFNLGFNTHSDKFFGPPLDVILDCVNDHATHAEAQESCSFFSNVITLPVPTPKNPKPATENMQAFIFQPIVMKEPDSEKGRLVATLSGAMNWQTLLSRAVPSYVSGLDCVVTTSDSAFTYSMENGVPTFQGIGDLHDTQYDKYARSIDLLQDTPGVSSFTSYQLTFYPRRAFFKVYETDAPLVTSIGGVAIILFCCFVFVLYDLAVSRESSRKELVLDTKRRFVRFISHEIRTPLNTVRLGLKLLEMEIHAMIQQLGTASPSVVSFVQASLVSWVQLTDDILGNSDSAVDVLNDLLNYDKIEMGTLRLEFSPVEIWSLVKKTAAAFVMQAKQKGVELQLIGECWAPGLSSSSSSHMLQSEVYEQLRVVGDSTRIAQVLRNLLSNALTFTPETGKVVVTAEWSAQGLPNANVTVPFDQAALLDAPRAGSIIVTVTDSGAGLSPQQLQEICAEGVQFNANQLQAGQGSGLGLFISKGLVEQHGGTLTVSSEGLGTGSTFRMDLSLFRMESEEDELTLCNTLRTKPTMSRKNPGEGAGAGAGDASVKVFEGEKDREDGSSVGSLRDHGMMLVREPSELTGPRRVMVVDDADSNRKLLIRILKAKGYLTEGAVNGQEALDVYNSLQLRGETVDAVLMDYEMPVMDGLEATKRLRAMGCVCLIVGVTGNVLPADIDLFKQHGANTVLAKPLNIEAFESTLQRFRPSVLPTVTEALGMIKVTDGVGVQSSSTDGAERRGKGGKESKIHPYENV